MTPHRRRHSSIGRKALMSISGLLLFGFVITHLLGNLLIFLGPEALNAYALKLRHLGPGLWAARLILLAAVVVHTVTSVQLAIKNRRARSVSYHVHRTRQTTWAAQTMVVSGALVFVYLVYHLLHLTFRVINPAIAHLVDPLGHYDVYRMIILGFQQWPIVLAYVVGVGAVCLHVSHGIGSSAQTLGLTNARTLSTCMRGGQLLAAFLFLGYSAIPIAVWLGLVK